MKIWRALPCIGLLLLLSARAQAAGAWQAPWSLIYSDGSANRYVFEQSSPGEEVKFDYSPVRPEESSTGMYSGGEPKSGLLKPKLAKDLEKRVTALEADASIRGSDRAKGTGSFTLKISGEERSFIINDGPALRKFNVYLKKLRPAPLPEPHEAPAQC